MALKNKIKARHRAFATAYTSNGRNGAQAAIAAGYSKKTARFAASRLLTNANVLAIVEELSARAEEVMNLTAEKALKINAAAVLFDPRKLFRADGTAKLIGELDDDTALAISHIGPQGFVPNDRLRALDMAFKNLGLYEKDNTQRAESLALEIVLVKKK